MRRLIAGAMMTGIVFAALTLYIDSQVSPSTPWIILLAGVTFMALAVTMLASTRKWSLRAVGLFFMLAGTATLLIGGYLNYRWPFAAQAGEAVNDAILSLWVVGCPLGLLGVAMYLFGGDRPNGEPPAGGKDGLP